MKSSESNGRRRSAAGPEDTQEMRAEKARKKKLGKPKSRKSKKRTTTTKKRKTVKARQRETAVVGWRESVALPDWGIASVKAKVDTGARTSAIHVENLEELEDGRVRFAVVRHRGDEEPIEVTAPIHRLSRVKPSTGAVEDRVVVKTRIRIGPIRRTVEVSLVSRERMLCRMLIGRNALPDGVVVDPHLRYLHGRPKRRRKSRRRT